MLLHEFKKSYGFTMLEVMVSMSLFVFIILMTGSFYSYSQKTYNNGADRAELTQNIRVSLDRLTRELRQTTSIITTLPDSENDPENPSVAEIIFQDGHDTSRISYIRYYLDGRNLMRERLAFYFPGSPDDFVYKNSIDSEGNPPEESVLENRIVGEYFDYLKFWGTGDLVYCSSGLKKNSSRMDVRTAIYGRN